MKGRDVGFQTTKEGEFWRVLLPGIYTMEVFKEGFQHREVQFAVIEQNPTLLNITLLNDSTRRADQYSINRGQQQQQQASSSTQLRQQQQQQQARPDDGDREDDEEKAGEDEDEEESTGLFGLPNPLAGLQKSVVNFFDKIPIIG